MRSIRILAAVLSLLPASLSAESGDRLRLQATWFEPTGELESPPLNLDASGGHGFRFGWEHLFTSRFGFELALGSPTELDLEGGGGSAYVHLGEVELLPVSGLLTWHWNPDARGDLYLGLGAAYVTYGEVRGRSGGASLTTDDSDFSWTARLGVDVPTSEHWGVSFAVDYLETTFEAGRVFDTRFDADLPLDPWILSFGAHWRR